MGRLGRERATSTAARWLSAGGGELGRTGKAGAPRSSSAASKRSCVSLEDDIHPRVSADGWAVHVFRWSNLSLTRRSSAPKRGGAETGRRVARCGESWSRPSQRPKGSGGDALFFRRRGLVHMRRRRSILQRGKVSTISLVIFFFPPPVPMFADVSTRVRPPSALHSRPALPPCASHSSPTRRARLSPSPSHHSPLLTDPPPPPPRGHPRPTTPRRLCRRAAAARRAARLFAPLGSRGVAAAQSQAQPACADQRRVV